MAISREFSIEQERRQKFRIALLAGSVLSADDQAGIIQSLSGESEYSYPAMLERAALKPIGAQVFAIGLGLAQGDFDHDSSNFPSTVNEAWSAILATLLWAGAHGAKLPLDSESRRALEKEVGQAVPSEVTDFSSYLKWAGAAAGLGAVMLARSQNPYLRIVALLLGGAAPLLEEKAAEGERTTEIFVRGPTPEERERAARIGHGSQSGVAVIKPAGEK